MSAVAVTRQEWLSERLNYLGATEIAAVAGKHKYSTALDVYLTKIGEKKETKTNRKAEAGLALEPLVRNWYSEEIGKPIAEGKTYFDKEYPFLACNTDGEFDDVLVEIKTMDFATRKEWGEPGTDEVPIQYYVQAIVQLGITGRRLCSIVKCDRGSMETEEYLVYPDEANYQILRAIGRDFWLNHVVKRIPPAPTEKDGDNLIMLFPEPTTEVLVSDPSIDELAGQMKELSEDYKPKEKRYKQLVTAMNIAIGNATAVETLHGTFTRTLAKGQISWKEVANALSPSIELIESKRGASFFKLSTPF